MRHTTNTVVAAVTAESDAAKRWTAEEAQPPPAEDRGHREDAFDLSAAELRALLVQLLTVHEDQRTKLARVLHDEVAQALVAALFRVDLALRQCENGQKQAARESGDTALGILRQAVENVTKLQADLRPSMLDDVGLRAVAESLCRQLREAQPGIRVTCEWGLSEADVPEPLKIVCCRVIQEGLENVSRHSGARQASIRLARGQERLELAVEDDGVGFDPGMAAHKARQAGGLGLGCMRHRVEASGGSFWIESAEGGGTRVRAAWPMGIPHALEQTRAT